MIKRTCVNRPWDPNLIWKEIQRSPKRTLHWIFRRLTAPWRGLPNLYVVGARKCGTTSLFFYLIEHPHILAPFRKEVKFYTFQFYLGPLWYRANFPLQHVLKGRFTLDATATYLMHPYFAERAFALTPHARIIVLLRNPIWRIISMYHQNRRRGLETLSLKEALKREQNLLHDELKLLHDPCYSPHRFELYGYLLESRYIEHLERLWKVFPKKQVLIIRSEDLFQFPNRTMHQVYRFLDLEPIPQTYPVYNPGNYHIDASLQPIIAWLQEYFQPYNERLYQALGRDLGWEQETFSFR